MRPALWASALSLLALAASCSNRNLTCPRTVEAFCASQPQSPLCAPRDYPGAMALACMPSGTSARWQAVDTCEGFGVIFEGGGTEPSTARYFEGKSGALVAIVSSVPGPDGQRCLGGPVSFALPSCDDPSAESCPRIEAGAAD
jgi:hypothetical protein